MHAFRSNFALLMVGFLPIFAQAQLPDDATKTRMLASYGLQNVTHQAFPHGLPEGYGWQAHADVMMGVDPTANSVPDWYEGIHHAEWRGIDGWFTVYEATDNHVPNVSVELADMALWYLSKNNVWQNIAALPIADWAAYYPENAIGEPVDAVSSTPGRLLVQPGNGLMAHGGTSHYATPWGADGADIQALFFSVKHRLVADAGVDVSQASYIVNAGVDFVPFVGAQLNPDSGAANYWPGAGLGQFIKTTPDWQYSNILITAPALTKLQLADTLNISAVPEPQSGALMLAGLALLGIAVRGRKTT